LARVADKTGRTRALSLGLAGLKQRQSGHDQGRVIRDLAVMLGDGGDCLSDLGALGDQQSLFGDVTCVSTAFRLIVGSPATRRAWSGCVALMRGHGRVCGG
jgi:hypothetical protein